MVGSLEIEVDANPSETTKFLKLENGVTRLSLGIFIGESGLVVVWS